MSKTRVCEDERGRGTAGLRRRGVVQNEGQGLECEGELGNAGNVFGHVVSAPYMATRSPGRARCAHRPRQRPLSQAHNSRRNDDVILAVMIHRNVRP